MGKTFEVAFFTRHRNCETFTKARLVLHAQNTKVILYCGLLKVIHALINIQKRNFTPRFACGKTKRQKAQTRKLQR